jgi:hypothetical protein
MPRLIWIAIRRQQTTLKQPLVATWRGGWGSLVVLWKLYALLPTPTRTPVATCTEETAWGGTTPGTGPAWWYYYDNTLANQQPIYAGQNLSDGTVTCDDAGQLSIALGSWSQQDRAETVKVQCYGEGQLPPERPSAGLFTTYKGAELTVPGFNCNDPSCRYIAIHLDVEQCAAP